MSRIYKQLDRKSWIYWEVMINKSSTHNEKVREMRQTDRNNTNLQEKEGVEKKIASNSTNVYYLFRLQHTIDESDLNNVRRMVRSSQYIRIKSKQR